MDMNDLQAELDNIKSNPAFGFFDQLKQSLEQMGEDIKNKELDLVDDNFQKSVFMLL